jgi:hypothetical protein
MTDVIVIAILAAMALMGFASGWACCRVWQSFNKPDVPEHPPKRVMPRIWDKYHQGDWE